LENAKIPPKSHLSYKESKLEMSYNELRKDYLIDRWVVIATDRARRPVDFLKPKTEPAIKKEEQKPEPSVNKEAASSGCPQAFGYLANRPKDVPIPQGCLVCPKMVDCMLSSRDDQTN